MPPKDPTQRALHSQICQTADWIGVILDPDNYDDYVQSQRDENGISYITAYRHSVDKGEMMFGFSHIVRPEGYDRSRPIPISESSGTLTSHPDGTSFDFAHYEFPKLSQFHHHGVRVDQYGDVIKISEKLTESFASNVYTYGNKQGQIVRSVRRDPISLVGDQKIEPPSREALVRYLRKLMHHAQHTAKHLMVGSLNINTAGQSALEWIVQNQHVLQGYNVNLGIDEVETMRQLGREHGIEYPDFEYMGIESSSVPLLDHGHSTNNPARIDLMRTYKTINHGGYEQTGYTLVHLPKTDKSSEIHGHPEPEHGTIYLR